MLMMTVLAGVAIGIPALPQADTTFPISSGMRLDVRNNEGEIRVSAWNRDEVRIRVGQGDDAEVAVRRSGSVVTVRPEPLRFRAVRTRGRQRFEHVDYDEVIADFEITVPSYLALSLRGLEADIDVRGVDADISAETIEGSVEVDGGAGFISLHSVEGGVRLTDASGRIEVHAGEGDIVLTDITGEITAESVDGHIELTGIDSRSVSASTVDGDVSFDGVIHDAGRYRLSTHDGDVTILLASQVNADVSVSSFEGDFETDFPIVLRESRSRRFNFTLGDGSAVIDLQSFEGDVFLRRRGR